MSAPGGEEAYRIDYDTYLFHNIEQTLEDIYAPNTENFSFMARGQHCSVCSMQSWHNLKISRWPTCIFIIYLCRRGHVFAFVGRLICLNAIDEISWNLWTVQGPIDQIWGVIWNVLSFSLTLWRYLHISSRINCYVKFCYYGSGKRNWEKCHCETTAGIGKHG